MELDYLRLNISPKVYQNLRGWVHGKVSEVFVRKVLIHSGYKVIRGETLIALMRTKTDTHFKTKEQKERIKRCLDIVDVSKKIGLPEYSMQKGIPDYFIYNDKEEFFIEVKCNKGRLNKAQKELFPLLNEIIPIQIARINLDWDLKSKDMRMYPLSENDRLQNKQIETLRKIQPELNDVGLNKILKILKNEVKKSEGYEDTEDNEDVILVSHEDDEPIEYEEEDVEDITKNDIGSDYH